MTEDDKASWWNRKKKLLVSNLAEMTDTRKTLLTDLEGMQKNCQGAAEHIHSDISRLDQMRKIYSSDAYLAKNPVFEGTVDQIIGTSSFDVKFQRELHSRAGSLATNMNALAGTLTASSYSINSMAVGTAHLAPNMIDFGKIEDYVVSLAKPTPLDRRNELLPKLDKFGKGISTKLEGAWQAINDKAKGDRFSQASNSARDMISDLLLILAPDEKVKNCEWFKPETPNGRPSQFQRARYAILGANDILDEKQLQPIDELAKSIRDVYEKLNPIVHQRKYENDLQATVENLIDQWQILALELLELRERFFRE
jgi:hypothetical protein